MPTTIADAITAAERGREPSLDRLDALLAEVRPLGGGAPGNRLAAITPALDAFTDPRGEVRRHLERVLPEIAGFHPRMLRVGLAIGARRLAPDALASMLALPHPRLARPRRRTAVVHAGNVPLLAALDVVLAVLAGDPVVVKSASREPVSGLLAAELVRRVTGVPCAAGVSWPREARSHEARLLGWAERLIVYGSDRAVAEIGARWSESVEPSGGPSGGPRPSVEPPERIVFAHRVSAAWAPAGGFPLPELARRLAVDVALWDQGGCLSPHVVFVERGVDAAALGEALAGALATLAERLPRGERTLEERAATRAWLSRVEASIAAGRRHPPRIWRDAAGAYAVVLDGTTPVGPSPLGRAIRLAPVADVDEMIELLDGWPLQAIGVGDAPGRHPDLVAPARALGVTRLCAAGRMQEPGPRWIGEEPDVKGRVSIAIEEELDGMWRELFDPLDAHATGEPTGESTGEDA